MDSPPPRVNVLPVVDLTCSKCTTGLQLAGSQLLRDESGAQHNLAPILPVHERLDVYLCPRCGRVEFFAAAAGEVPRAEPAAYASGLEGKVEQLLREANQLELQEQIPEAVARYEAILSRYPGTNYARESERRLTKIRTKLDK
jgi:hypothetical protein